MNIIKKLLSLLLCVCVVLSVVGNSVYVNADTEPVWYNACEIAGTVTRTNEVMIRVSINGEGQTLHVSFPTTGGVRITLASDGFFSPEALCDIETVSNENSILTVRAPESGAAISIDRSVKPWRINILNSAGGKAAVFSGEDMLFGYRSGVLSQVKLQSAIRDNEYFYGLGERFDNFILNGTSVDLWNRDSWSKDGTAYKNLPILNSTYGYMLFFNTAYQATADIGDTQSDRYSLEFKGPKFDFYIFAGERDKINKEYTALTGRSFLPPEWAFRYWAGEASLYWESQGADKSVELLEDVLNGYKNYGITDIAALFGESTLYKYPRSFELLKPSGTRLLAWANPFVLFPNLSEMFPDKSTDPTENALPRLRVPDKSEYTDSDVIDFTHPLAEQVIEEQWSKAIDDGIHGLMIDYCEYVPIDSVSYNGTLGAEYHNQYTYDYARTFYELFSSRLDNDFILYSRSAAAGSQKYAALFSGDQTSDFDGLTRAVKALLSISSCGFSTWGSDIGGLGVPQSSEVFMRWTQFAAMSPLMKLHGQGPSDPWNFSDEAQQSFLTHYWLRENLIKKIYSSAVEATVSGKPMSSSMAAAFEKQQNLLTVDDQFLFCDDLLVCPVLEAGALSRNVALPLGNWTDIWTGEIISGGRTVKADAPITHSPIYIRSGAAIPIEVSTETLVLADPIAEESGATDALLVTAPDGSRTGVYRESETESTQFVLQASAKNAFTISADKTQTERIVLAYGIDADQVFVDSRPLTALSSVPTDESTAGFYNGEKGAVIRTDADWSHIEIVVKSVSFGEDEKLPDMTEKPQSTFLANNDNLAETVCIDVPDEKDFDIFHTVTAADGQTVMTATSFSDRFNVLNGYIQHIWDMGSVNFASESKNVLTTALYNKKKYRNFEVSVEFKGTLNVAGNASAMIVFGVEDPISAPTRENGGFLIRLEKSGNSVLSGFSDGVYKEISDTADYRTLGNFKNNWDNWYKLTVRVSDGIATVTVDPMIAGYQPYSYSYELGADYSGGFIGFAANCQISKYRNIQIKDLGGEVRMDTCLTLIGDQNTEYLFDAFYGSNADEEGLEHKAVSDAFAVKSTISHTEGDVISEWSLQDKDITTAIYTVKSYRDFELKVKMSGSMGESANGYYWPMLVFGVEDPTDWVNKGGGGFCVGTYNEGNTFLKGCMDGEFKTLVDPTKRNDSEQRAQNGYFVGNNYSWWYLTVRVEDKKATVTVEPGYYWGDGESWSYSYTYKLPQNYKGGYIGFGSTAVQSNFWSMQIKDLGGEVFLNGDIELSDTKAVDYLFEQNGEKTLFKQEYYTNFEAGLEIAGKTDVLYFGADADKKSFKVYVCQDGSISFEGTVNKTAVALNDGVSRPEINEDFSLKINVFGYEATVVISDRSGKEYRSIFRLGKEYCGGNVGFSTGNTTSRFYVIDYGKKYFSSLLAGDCDINGSLDAQDLRLMRKLLIGKLKKTVSLESDINWDGQTDIRDLVALKKAVA